MAFKMAGVLEILDDGRWHTLEEVRRRMKLNRNQIRQVAGFLEKYGFVKMDLPRKKMKIEEAVRMLLALDATS